MIDAPRGIEKFKVMKFVELIKEKHKIMKKIISLEKEIYLEVSDEVQDPDHKMILNIYYEELNVMENLLENKNNKKKDKGIFI